MKYFGLFALCLFACFGVSTAHAATRTVCSSGCNYTTIGAALGAVAEGDTIQVNGGGGSPYSASSESYNLTIATASTTIQCINGATIGQTSPSGSNAIYLTTSSTVMGCTLQNVRLLIDAPESVSGVIISNNSFVSGSTSTIDFAS